MNATAIGVLLKELARRWPLLKQDLGLDKKKNK